MKASSLALTDTVRFFKSRRRRAPGTRLPLGSLTVLVVVVILAIFADQVAPYGPLAVDLSVRLEPPVLFGGTLDHPLGTDDLGRDILSRVIHGARISLLLAGASIALGAVVGTTAGLIAGYVRGFVDVILMRIADIAISYPVILIALLLAVVFGQSGMNVVIAISVFLWPQFARVIRGEVLLLRETDYVALAHVAGASAPRIIVRHILPNVGATIAVLASLTTGNVILAESGLSFLGAGVPAPAPAWGSMAALGRDYITTGWWLSAVPSIAILVVVLSLNVFGDWLRDRLDPRLQAL